MGRKLRESRVFVESFPDVTLIYDALLERGRITEQYCNFMHELASI